MKIHVKAPGAAPGKTTLEVRAVFDDLAGFPEAVPAAQRKDFKGELGAWTVAYGVEGRERLALLGLGAQAKFDAEAVRRAAAAAVNKADAAGATQVAIDWSAAVATGKVDPLAFGRAAAEGARLAAYSFLQHKGSASSEKEKKGCGVDAVTFLADGKPFKSGVAEGLAAAAGVCLARDLANQPGNEMTPTKLAAEAKKLARNQAHITCNVLDEAEMKRLGMGALLGVSKGSVEPAKLIHLRYRPAKATKNTRKFCVVGKGLTFDTGGISLKPSARMEDMKYDMCGGAAVLGLFRALQEIDFPHEIHGVVASSENMPGGSAQKPGDVVTAMNGVTIEVLNTDAEGRLILSDALSWASKTIQPEAMVDLATLTGAVVVALGHEATGVMGDDTVCAQLLAAGEATGERCWRLPLWDVHREMMKSDLADLRNINGPSDGAGSTAGGAFLSYFIGEGIRWAHLDIAGTAWGVRSREYGPKKGAAGVGVRLLLEWLRNV